MENEEIAQLKNEIARLNKVVEALIKYNDLLSAEIALAKTGRWLPHSGMVHAETGKALSNEEMVYAKTGNGNPDASKSLSETDLGNSRMSEPLPGFIEPTPQMLLALRGILKQAGFNKVRHAAIRNACILLIPFHNKRSGDHHELGKLIGLSRYGTAKFVASLKKRELIHRSGWQQFDVSQSGQAMILEAWLKTDGMKSG